MRLIFIRHGEPDYSIDSLTEKGWREAELVGERLKDIEADAVFCSPLGRAKDTMKPYLEKTGKAAVICDWLKEFNYKKIIDPKTNQERIIWDFKPEFLDENKELFDKDDWRKADFIKNSEVPKAVDYVFEQFDKCLENYGYVREGTYYKTEKGNHKTLLFFCHFGIISVLLAHLFNTSPNVVSHNFVALPSSVTTLITEEREEGKAYFRCQAFGDTSHLYKANEPLSFAARFCETFSDPERHESGE